MFVSGSLLNFASYAFAPQSMLASLESVQFVTNILFGKFMLKAKVTSKMYIGTGVTVLGEYRGAKRRGAERARFLDASVQLR